MSLATQLLLFVMLTSTSAAGETELRSLFLCVQVRGRRAFLILTICKIWIRVRLELESVQSSEQVPVPSENKAMDRNTTGTAEMQGNGSANRKKTTIAQSLKATKI